MHKVTLTAYRKIFAASCFRLCVHLSSRYQLVFDQSWRMKVATVDALTTILQNTVKNNYYPILHSRTLIKSKQHVTVPSTTLMLELGWAKGHSCSLLPHCECRYSGHTSNFSQDGSREAFPLLELLAGDDGLAGFAPEELLMRITTNASISQQNTSCELPKTLLIS